MNDLPVIYVDRVWILNAVIDYLLLLTTAQLIGATRHRWRLVAAALFGGGYAVAVFVFPVAALVEIRQVEKNIPDFCSQSTPGML